MTRMNGISGVLCRLSSRGTATVEMAIVVPLLITLLFGTVDMGLLLKDSLVLNTASREATRVAVLGKSSSEIGARALAAASTLRTADIEVDAAFLAGGTWVPLGDTGEGTNDAPTGSLVRVTLRYPHHFIFRPFGEMCGDGEDHVRTLVASTVAMRE